VFGLLFNIQKLQLSHCFN